MAYDISRWHCNFRTLGTSAVVALLAAGMAIAAPADEKPAPDNPIKKPEVKRGELKRGEGPELLKPKDPATKPATQPAKAKLEVSKEARELLDAVRDAYKGVKSLKLAGSIIADIDMNGEQIKNTAEFTAAYESPLKFRHQSREQASAGKTESQLFGGTGKKLYAFEPRYNYVYLADAPKDRVKAGDLPKQVVGLMSQLNPSLLLAVVPDAAEELMDGIDKLAKVGRTVLQQLGRAPASKVAQALAAKA